MADLTLPPLVLASSSNSIVSTAGASIISYNIQTSKTVSSPSVDNRTHLNGFIRHVAVSQDGKIIASIGDDKSLKVWDVTDEELKLRSTRGLIKKASHVIFSSEGSIIISDKVGDVYSYPLDPVPSDPSTSRPPMYSMVSDPTKNPDCTYLLGHVSVTTSHLITPDNKYIITADRDEHIRISRYPKAYVIENQLFGHDGFVSSIHIPPSQPTKLISGGGDSSLRIWDWSSGSLLDKVDIYPSILPHRKVRSYLRKRITKGRSKKVEEPSSTSTAEEAESKEEGGEEESETFYSAPEGYILPSGQGVCIKKIDSIKVGDVTIVMFFSEGASAIHSFVLPPDFDSSSAPPTVQTLPLPYPVLDFIFLPNEDGKVLLSLDTAWGVLKKNPGPGNESRQDVIPKDSLSESEKESLNGLFRVFDVQNNAELTESSSTSLNISSLTSSLPKGDMKTISNLNLYPLLNILPRWPGLEEQEDGGGGDTTPITPEDMGLESQTDADGISIAPTNFTTRTFGGTNKTYTKDELSKMNSKVLGRLKSAGVDIGNLLLERQKKAKEDRRRKLEEVNARDKAQQQQQQQQQKGQGKGKGGGEPDKKKKKVQISEEELANA